jgi:chemotaxis signal transduction protein
LQVRHKSALEQAIKAQITIDILVRNLFERTADIGFLATDDDLRRFASASVDERRVMSAAMRQRLREYQRKYSVYEDILLLSPEGDVLVRLDDEIEDIPRTRDGALLHEALSTQRPYVEIYRFFDLRPRTPRSLVYASRVTNSNGHGVLGVLCLVFRFEDECERIFRKFVGLNDWSVVALLDAQGHVIASSDTFQVPLGAQVAAPDDGGAHTVRFAGRRWLAVSCAAHAFQGYEGPGWRGHAMTPLEHAFAEDQDEAGLDAHTADQLRGSKVLHPDALHEIEFAAQRIQTDLSRAVWNANIALSGASQDALLREIGRTGSRTRESFTQALDAMSGSIAATTLAGGGARAALAIDIMDRSLYERANDCRWWALTTHFRSALEAPSHLDGTSLGAILRMIHGLYTVYANLVLFNRAGVIVAVSREEGDAVPGRHLDAEWVHHALTLPDPQAYCVSAFEPTGLYGGQPTYIYAAAVRGLKQPGTVVGGIAIVFDSAPQFRSMLQDTLPRDQHGEPLEGAFSLFVSGEGNIIASSHEEPAIGSAIDDAATLLAEDAVNKVQVRQRNGRWYAVGAARSTGYREFKGPDDAYQETVLALMYEALTDNESAAVAQAPKMPSMPQRSTTSRLVGERVDLALLRIGDQWHAVLGADVVEAIHADTVLPLPGSPPYVRGSVLFGQEAIAVLEADALLGQSAPPEPPQQRQIVVLRSRERQNQRFGLLVDELGDNPQVLQTQLVRLAEAAWQRGPASMALIDTLVAPTPGSKSDRALLTLLSAPALEALVLTAAIPA